jgi:iron(III) transport system permease protein
MFSFTGTITRAFRSLGLTVHLNIMTLLGAAVIFVLVLYPYVYMIVRSALYKQSASYAESARTLGLSPRKVFFRITLPLLRPAMVAGTFLVLLETLNDYGLVSYFNVRVFSFAIFDAWFRLGDLSAAIRLSAILLVMVLALVVLERFLRGNRRYTMDVRGRPMLRTPLQGVQKSYPVILWSVLTVALFVPVLQLSYYAVLTYERVLNFRLIQVIVHSLTLSLGVTVVIVFIGLMMANVNRQGRSVQKNLLIRFTTLGYAIPGAVIAVAVLVSFVAVDRRLSPLYRLINPQSGRLVLTQSLLMLAFAMVLRFLAIGYSNIEATYDKIGERFTQAAYTLKHGKLKTLWRVDLPLLKGGLVAAFIIVFIDVLKELPLTLILRPTNYDTLASYVFVFAREEMIQETAIPSLTIIFLAIGAIVALTHVKENKGVRHVRSD